MAELSKTAPRSRLGDWRSFLPPLALFVFVLLAYFPALRGGFIWDDDYNILKSAPLRTFDGLRRIWLEPGATQQYYPLTHSSFWLDYHLWGLHPWPFHLENLLLHALSAVLLWRLLQRLGARGPWFAAALFAVHPVCVESVAWITERKNTLSCVFCLLCLLAAAEFWLPRAIETRAPVKSNKPPPEFGHWKFYWLTLMLYVFALWSKTAVVGLPGVILLIAWWKRGRLIRRDALLIAPFLACGFALSLVTIYIERHLMVIGAGLEEWKFSPLQRLLIASRAFWFYLGKIIWPHPLMFMYPRWDLQTSQMLAFIPLIAALAVFIFLWRKRNGWARPVLAALGCFVAILFPVLGAFNVFFYRYSFVCDHFQYVAAIAPIALASAGFVTTVAVFSKDRPLLKPAVCAALLLVLGLLTRSQTFIYHDRETLWRDSIAHNPNSWMAHDNLGIWLSQAGRYDEADTQYQTAITLHSNDYIAYYDMGLESAIQANLDDAVAHFTKALQICPTYGLAHYDLANVLVRKGNLDDAVREYHLALETNPDLALAHFNLANVLVKQNKSDDAIQQYNQTLEIDPSFTLAQITLGRLLAAQGKMDDAIMRFRLALDIDPNSVDALANLANTLLKQGRLEEAVASYRQALQLNPNSPVIHYDLGVALSRQGKPSEAQDELNLAKQLQTARP